MVTTDDHINYSLAVDMRTKSDRLREINVKLSELPRLKWDVALLMERQSLLMDIGLYEPVGP